jgi:hypothetical protein
MLLHPPELEEATDSHRLFKRLRSSLVEIGIQGLNENVLAGLARYKPGRIGDQPPVALGVQSHRQGDGVLRSMGRANRRHAHWGRSHRWRRLLHPSAPIHHIHQRAMRAVRLVDNHLRRER